MREQLLDAMDRRDDLRRGRRRLHSSVLVLVQPRLPGAAPDRLVDAGRDPGKDHPLRGGARDPRLGRSAPAHRSARPPLLRLLPSGAGRRPADLRRGGADPGNSRARSRRSCPTSASAVEPERATTAVFYSITNCQRGLTGVSFGNFLIKQVVEEVSREVPRVGDLRHAVAGAEFRRMAQARARARGLARARRGGPRCACRARRRRVVAPAGRSPKAARAAVARRRLVLSCAAATAAACRSTRSPASISATARGWSGSTGSPTRRSGRSQQSYGLMVNYLYDLDYIEQKPRGLRAAAHGRRRGRRDPAGAAPVREMVPVSG